MVETMASSSRSIARRWTVYVGAATLLTSPIGCGRQDRSALCTRAARKIADCTQRPLMPVSTSCSAESAELVLRSSCLDLVPNSSKSLGGKDLVIGAAVLGIVGVSLAWLFSDDSSTPTGPESTHTTPSAAAPIPTTTSHPPAASTTASARPSCQAGTPGVWLWRADKVNHQRLYLYGTQHKGVLPKEIPECVWSRLLDPATTLVVSEVDGRDPGFEAIPTTREALLEQQGLQQALAREGFGAHMLQDLVTPEVWGRLSSNAFRSRYLGGMDLSTLQQSHPRLLALMIEDAAVRAAVVARGQVEQLDLTFINRGLQEGKDLRALETPQDRMRLSQRLNELDRLAPSLAHLEFWVSNPGAGVQGVNELADAYRAGDTQAIVRRASGGDPEVSRTVFRDRNRAWLPQLEQISRSSGGHVFGVVGLAHLVGPDNVLDLLRSRGWRITRGPALPTET